MHDEIKFYHFLLDSRDNLLVRQAKAPTKQTPRPAPITPRIRLQSRSIHMKSFCRTNKKENKLGNNNEGRKRREKNPLALER